MQVYLVLVRGGKAIAFKLLGDGKPIFFSYIRFGSVRFGKFGKLFLKSSVRFGSAKGWFGCSLVTREGVPNIFSTI